jgi:hypothetical protein
VKHKEEPMDEYKSRLSSYLQSVVREELEKYDGGFTDEMNDQREKNAEVLGYKLSGTSDVKEELLDENILKQIQQAEKIAKSMAGNMTGAVKGIEKIRRGLSRHKRVKVALKKYNESIDETKERDYKAEYKKYGSSTKAKKYRAELNQYNRKKGTYGNGDGKDASHKGGKIVGFEKESKNRGRAEKSRLKKESAINEETYFDPKGEFKKYMDKTFKRAGIKVLKFNPMKQSFHNGAWGGFYTVKSNHKGQMGATQKSDVLPVFISRVGEIELGIKSGGFHIGKAGSSQVLKNLKDFKKSDLDESYKTLTEGIKARMGEIAKQGEWEVYDPQTDKTIKVVKNSGAATRLMNRLMNSGQYEEIASRHVETHKKKFENISVNESGILYKAGVKKYGKEGMAKILSAAGKKKSHAKIGAIKDKYEKDKKESVDEGTFGKYDTGAAFKGNGMTIYDRNQSQGGDFKNIAHISEDGKLTIWDKNIKKEPKLMQSLKKISQEFKTSFKESVLSVTEGQKREASNIMRKYDLAFLKFSREIRDVIKMVDRSTGSKVDGKIIEKSYEKGLIPLNKIMIEWDRGQQQNPGLSEESVVNEKISKEEWAQYPAYARKLKPYMQKLLKVSLKVKVIKQANHNPWIGVRVARFGKDIIPNDFRVKVAKSIGASAVRDWDNVNYGGIRVNSIDLRYEQWVKIIGDLK